MNNFLRKLELQGFKSFAGKTTLEFPARIVAIVGPNGSGKSNIIDAFRWVLGERDAKHLRGNTLDNLIFGGTEKRASVSLARVSLFFDNSDKLFPIDTTEIEISRKIDRSGVSQFFIHDSEIRLKNLVPMLASARLGSRGITMIGQGQGDLFVKSSPNERREMVEEVLGLREFRIKKNQAERRLLTTESNMEKTRALIAEISPYLKTLLRQKHRWEKRSEVAKNLFNLENRYFSAKYNIFKNSLENFKEPSDKFAEEIKRMREDITISENKLKENEKNTFDRKDIEELRSKISDLFSEKIEAEREYARHEAKSEIKKEASVSKTHSVSELTDIMKTISKKISLLLEVDDISKIKKMLSVILENINNIFQNKAEEKETEINFEENNKEERLLRGKLLEIDEKIKELQEKEDNILSEQQKSHQKFRVEIQKIENKKNELRKIEQKVQEITFERDKVFLKIEDLKRDWNAIGRREDELLSLPIYGEDIDFQDAERRMMRLRGELSAIGEIDENLVKEADETEKRHTFLTKELGDLETAKRDLQNLVKELDERIHKDFKTAFSAINTEFNNYFQLMFGGGKAKMKLSVPRPVLMEEDLQGAEEKPNLELSAGIEIEISIPKKRITNLDMLSGGEKSLVSLAALFALISVSPPPFLVLDEIDAPLDEENARRFAGLVEEFSKKTQFVIVTHNRATMEVAEVLYGITMGDDGVSKILSLKLE